MNLDYVKFYKSRVVTSSSSNGGPKGDSSITSGMKFDVMPRARKDQLVDGLDRYFKVFFCYFDIDGNPLTDFQCYMKIPSTAGDVQLIALSENDEIQGDMLEDEPIWVGAGQLNVNPSGNSTVELIMESDKSAFLPGGYLYITDSFLTSQVIDDGSIPGRPIVKVGDSCEWITDSWRKADKPDYVYPNGINIGGQTVMTISPTTKESSSPAVTCRRLLSVPEYASVGLDITILPLTVVSVVTNI